MIIKLYKNCILTDAYSEVFDVYRKDANGKTALDRYLETLEQKTIATPHTYVTNSGKISFDLNDEDGTEFYDFNYMSITDEVNNFTRFCFIDAVTVVNGIAVVSYIEDLWSNYAPSLQMRKSLLTRSRIIDYGSYKIPFYSLGMEYQGNNQLKLTRLFDLSTASPEINVVVQLQLYKLSEQGELSERLITEAFLAFKRNDVVSNDFDISLAELVIQRLMQDSSSKKISIDGIEFNYEIYNITFIPKDFEIPVNTIAPSATNTQTTIGNTTAMLRIISPLATDTKLNITNTKTITCNFKQFKIGSLITAYDIVQNGTNIEIRVGYQTDFYDFKLFIMFQNQIYDITSDFKIEVPISIQTADVTQQQSTAREMAQFNAKMGIASGAMQIGSAVVSGLVGGAKTISGIATGSDSMIMSGVDQMGQSPFNVGRGIMNIISSAKQLEIANRAMYVSNRGCKITGNSVIASYYGIVIYEIQPDNEVEVQANIDNCGYVCNEIVDNLLNSITTGTTNKWNVMQFEYVNIYGKFTQRIADALRDILYAGFKIWYDETAINE